jgi:hypothetical protein
LSGVHQFAAAVAAHRSFHFLMRDQKVSTPSGQKGGLETAPPCSHAEMGYNQRPYWAKDTQRP